MSFHYLSLEDCHWYNLNLGYELITHADLNFGQIYSHASIYLNIPNYKSSSTNPHLHIYINSYTRLHWHIVHIHTYTSTSCISYIHIYIKKCKSINLYYIWTHLRNSIYLSELCNGIYQNQTKISGNTFQQVFKSRIKNYASGIAYDLFYTTKRI